MFDFCQGFLCDEQLDKKLNVDCRAISTVSFCSSPSSHPFHWSKANLTTFFLSHPPTMSKKETNWKEAQEQQGECRRTYLSSLHRTNNFHFPPPPPPQPPPSPVTITQRRKLAPHHTTLHFHFFSLIHGKDAKVPSPSSFLFQSRTEERAKEEGKGGE